MKRRKEERGGRGKKRKTRLANRLPRDERRRKERASLVGVLMTQQEELEEGAEMGGELLVLAADCGHDQDE